MSDNPTPAPALAKHAKVTREPGRREFDLTIDGKPFPWYIGADTGVKVELTSEKVSAVTVTILVEHVEVDDRMMSDRSEDVLSGHFHEELVGEVQS